MPESPDFKQIARELAPAIGPEEPFPYPNTVSAIAEQLRLVWNARGAADVDAVKGAVFAHKDPRGDIRGAIEQLDR